MKSTIYNLNENGKLVEEMATPATPLTVGQIITYEDRANPRKEFVILGSVPPSNYTSPGTMRALCLDDGHESQVREVDNNGHAGWQMGKRILSADELLDAIRTAGENKARIEAERAAASIVRAQKETDQRAKWAVEFDFLQTVASGCRSHVLGAKNIRAELKRAFPGVKFSVTSDSYTGGNSIDVHWQAGPTTEAVEKITSKYQEGHFDGMEDIYRDSGNQWNDIYGGAKYVMESRSFAPELHEQIGRGLCALQGVEFAGQWTRGLLGQNDDRDLQQHVNGLLNLTTWPTGAEFDRVESTDDGDCVLWKRLFEIYGAGFANKENRAKMTPEDQAAMNGYESRMGRHWCRIVFKSSGGNKPEAKPEPTAPRESVRVFHGAGVAPALVFNREKNGVEIHFPAKPDADTLASLKKQGWKWAKSGGCWYHRASTFAAEWAADLVGFSAEHKARFVGELGGTMAAPVEVAPPEPKAEEMPAGFDPVERWGNSAIVGLDVNSPAMMEARAAFKASQPPEKKTVPALVAELKQAEQDREFYPTTDAIIKKLCAEVGMCRDITGKEYERHHNSAGSFLDIGAGNGKVLKAVKYWCGIDNLHAIEKSPILCAELDKDVLIVGTDFHEQSLLSKPVDVIFCNPPYSEFEAWAEKIIREGASRKIFLVLPVRWENSQRIKDALKFRDVSARIVGKFDFEDAEDRRARAVVHLIEVNMRRSDRKETWHEERGEDDAFNRFFEEQFADLLNRFKASEARSEGDKAEREAYREAKRPEFAGLVVGKNYPETLVGLYNQEMAKIHANYQLVAKLDVSLLKEFNIEPATILKCLKERLNGLKNDYWMELFSNLSTITNRLTSASRKSLLDRLHAHVAVDFTVSNIYEVVCWVIKNANHYIDAQLIAVYENMVDKCNVQLYKSNKKTWQDNGWRYGKPEITNTHFALDYRIVTHRMGGIENRYGRSELDGRAADFIGDLRTIARNLGFDPSGDLAYSLRNLSGWEAGSTEEFFFRDSTITTGRIGFGTLFDVKAFKNGNLHLRLNKKFILALNVEHGRLKGWLRSGEQAAEELQDDTAAQYFNGNQQISAGSPFSMLAENNL